MTTPLGSTSATTTTAATGTTGTSASSVSALGPDAFMKLLVAQLKYQNPMAPADGQQYMAQMATFAQVEKLDALVKAQADVSQWQQRVTADGLVGRSVSSTVDGVTTSGTVTGVRYLSTGPLLELSNGTTLKPGLVDHVGAPTASTSSATTTGASSTPATTGTSTTGTSTTSTTSAAAPAAGTPSA